MKRDDLHDLGRTPRDRLAGGSLRDYADTRKGGDFGNALILVRCRSGRQGREIGNSGMIDRFQSD